MRAQPESGTAPAHRVWRDGAGRVALLLIAGQALWRGILLARGFFTQDDYQMLRLGNEKLSVDLLVQDYSGHLWPGNFILAWAHARLGPLEWPMFVAEILVLQATAAVLAWLVLSRLLPGSAARVPLLVIALFCPLTWWPTAWWAAAIGFLPTSITMLLATWALLVHLQDGRRWAPFLVVAAVVTGLLFQERALLIPVVLGFVAAAYAPVTGPRAVVAALRARRLLWLTLVVLLGGYLLLRRSLAPIETTEAGSPRDGLELVWNFVVRTAVPGLLGGPWNPDVLSDVLLVPATYAVVVPWVVLAGVVVWTLRRGGAAAGWGWLLLATYVAADVALLFAGRTSLGPSLALSPRYAADIVPVLPIALGLVAQAVIRRRADVAEPAAAARTRDRRRGVVLVGSTVAYLVSAAVTMQTVTPHTQNSADRSFVETLRGELREQPDVVLLDSTPPDDIMTFWFGSDARVSTLVGLAPEVPVFDLPSHDLRIPDADGRLRPVELVAAESMVARSDVCGYAVTERPTRVPLDDSVTGEQLVARITYFTSARGSLRIQAGDSDQIAVLRRSGAVYVPLTGSVDSVTLSLDEGVTDDASAGGTVCVTGLGVGFPVARSGT